MVRFPFIRAQLTEAIGLPLRTAGNGPKARITSRACAMGAVLAARAVAGGGM